MCDGAVKGIVCLLLCLPCVFVYVSADGVALVVMFVGGKARVAGVTAKGVEARIELASS